LSRLEPARADKIEDMKARFEGATAAIQLRARGEDHLCHVANEKNNGAVGAQWKVLAS
jgi:hypothetical protein